MRKWLPGFLEKYARETPSASAAVIDTDSLSYGDLDRRVKRLQRQLLAAGLTRLDRIAVLTTPGFDYYVSLLAAHGLGAIWVGVNPKYRFDEIKYIVNDCAPKLVLYIASFEGRNYGEDFSRIKLECSWEVDLIEIPTGGLGCLALPETEAHAVDSIRSHVSERDPAVIVYTSGSSGKPKGALLSHFALVYGAEAQLARWRVRSIRELCFWPINHVGCIGDVTATALVAGGQLTFQPRFDVSAVIAALKAGDASVFLAVPTMLQLILGHPAFDPECFRSVELIVWGGASAPEGLVRQLATLGPRLATIYGMTEAAANTFYTEENASLEVLANSAGKPLPEFPARLINGDRLCGPGEPGEIQHRGPFMFLGYFSRPDATAAAFTNDGWYRTGDLGVWRDDGNLRVVGRLTDMFKSGGYNVYPREVENCIEEHPSVAMAAVVSVADDLYQEVGVAFVVPRAGHVIHAQALRDFCRSKLANYKVPKRFVLQDELPLLPIGKVDKKLLQRQAADQSCTAKEQPELRDLHGYRGVPDK